MSLKGYQLPTKTIVLPGEGSLTLRGLALPDIAKIVENHRPMVEQLFSKYAEDSTNDDLENITMIGQTLVESAPLLLAHVVAISADEPEEWEVVSKLPFPVQLEAIEAVGKLTFEGSGGVKKVVEMVIKAVKSVTDLAVDARVSKASSMDSTTK